MLVACAALHALKVCLVHHITECCEWCLSENRWSLGDFWQVAFVSFFLQVAFVVLGGQGLASMCNPTSADKAGIAL